MKYLIKEVIRSFRKHFFQFLGLIFFVMAATLTFTALFTSIYQIKHELNQVNEKSGTYDYDININKLQVKSNDKIASNSFAAQFLSNFYPDWESHKDTESLNTLITDASKWTCSNNTCTPPPGLNPSNVTTDAFSSLILNYNKNVNAALVSYLFNQNADAKDFGLSFVDSYNFVDNLNISNQYFLAENVYNSNVYKNDKAEYQWVNNNLYQNEGFNQPFDFYHNTAINKINTNLAKTNSTSTFNSSVFLSHQYASYNRLSINSNFNLNLVDNNGNNLLLKIGGWGYRVSDISPLLANLSALVKGDYIDYRVGTQIYVNNDTFQAINKKFINGTNTITAYVKNKNHINQILATKKISSWLNDSFNDGDDALTDFNSSIIGGVVLLVKNDFIIDVAIAGACSIVIIIIIGFFIKKDIQSQHKQIGLLKSFGYKRLQLASLFVFNVLFSVSIACSIGWILSIPLQIYFTNFNIYMMGLNLTNFYFNTYILVFVIIVVPVIFLAFAYLISFILLNKSALNLLYNLKSNNFVLSWKKIKKHRTSLQLYLGFKTQLSFSFAARSVGKWLMVMIILTFASFLLFFQFDAGLMSKNIVNNAFRYFNDDVKSYLPVSYDNSNFFTAKYNFQNNSNEGYKWLNINDPGFSVYQKTFISELQSDGSYDFKFKDPDKCIDDLIHDPSNKTEISATCGDLLNLIGGAGKKGDNKSNIHKNTYITGADFKAIVKYPWTKVIPILKKYESEFPQIDNLIAAIQMADTYAKETGNYYPNIYFGPDMIYDSNFDYPYVIKPARWSILDPNTQNMLINNIKLVGLPQSEKIRKQFFNFGSKTLSDADVQTKVFANVFNYKPKVNKNEIINSDNPIPILLSKRLYDYLALKPNSNLILSVKLSSNSGYQTVAFKIIGADENDISSSNFYVNEQQISWLINAFLSPTQKLNDQTIPNTVASKIGINGESIFPYRILSFFSLKPNTEFSQDSDPYDLTLYYNNSLHINTNYNFLKVLADYKKITPFALLRNSYKLEMESLSNVLTILEVLTVFIVTLILGVLVSMVLDENKRIILTMKVLGYSLTEIIFIVLGFYLFAIIIGYLISYAMSYGIWKIILNFLFRHSGILLSVPFSVNIILLTVFIVLLIIMVCLALGFWKIKRNSLRNINLE